MCIDKMRYDFHMRSIKKISWLTGALKKIDKQLE